MNIFLCLAFLIFFGLIGSLLDCFELKIKVPYWYAFGFVAGFICCIACFKDRFF